MPEQSEPTTTSTRANKPIQILRQRRGGVPRGLVERYRHQGIVCKRLNDALREGPMTVPELAQQVDLPADEVLWYVMGMKKYGKVAEADQADGYFKYRLVDQPRHTEERT
ncbi:MAG: hypothetical protein QM844_04965 [Planctomycetota bacterium]|nr:hypothetical protein [Planctomycetota bacterium]